MGPQLAYPFAGALYVNLTQRCPTRCTFCFKETSGRRFRGFDLSLEEGEPSPEQVWSAVLARAEQETFREFVFCGFGECTYRLDVMQEVGSRLGRRFPLARRRLNTIGLGSAIWGRDIVPDLARCLDGVAVSLNTADPEQWARLHRPLPQFRAGGFQAALSFARRCVEQRLDTVVTAVELPGIDLDAVACLALSMGAAFRARPRLGAEQA